MNTEKLFSYGTLQYETVQLANFDRKLDGESDQYFDRTHECPKKTPCGDFCEQSGCRVARMIEKHSTNDDIFCSFINKGDMRSHNQFNLNSLVILPCSIDQFDKENYNLMTSHDEYSLC